MSLPHDSAYARSVNGGPAAASITDQLIARVVDFQNAWLWGRSDPKRRGDPPASVLAAIRGEPHEEVDNRTSMTRDELYARLVAQQRQ